MLPYKTRTHSTFIPRPKQKTHPSMKWYCTHFACIQMDQISGLWNRGGWHSSSLQSHSLIQPASEWWSQVISDYYYDIALKCSKVFISDLTFRLEEWWTQPRAFYCRIFNSGCPKMKGVNNMWIYIYFYSNVFCLGIWNERRKKSMNEWDMKSSRYVSIEHTKP